MRYAIGASLVSVIATSSGAAAAYLREGYSNMRVGMFLEIATTVGAICGAVLAGHLSDFRDCDRVRGGAAVFGLQFDADARGTARGLPPDRICDAC